MDPPEDKRRYHLRDSLSEGSTKHGSDESRRPLTEDHSWGEEGSDAAPSVARSDSGDRVPVSLVPAPLGGLSDLVWANRCTLNCLPAVVRGWTGRQLTVQRMAQ